MISHAIDLNPELVSRDALAALAIGQVLFFVMLAVGVRPVDALVGTTAITYIDTTIHQV